MKMLPGETSPCRTPCAWAQPSALASAAPWRAISAGAKTAPRSSAAPSGSPSISSMTIHGSPPCSKAPSIRTMCG
jgi:hypothetical protein